MATEHPATIYKIISRKEWNDAIQAGVFVGAAIDHEDGYIHFSTAEQSKETAARHFAGQHDLLLIGVPVESLGNELKWEPSRGGDLFPHLYGSLDPNLASSVDELPLDSTGNHQFPWPDGER